MEFSILTVCYLIGSLTFIIGLKMLSNPASARKGNLIAAAGNNTFGGNGPANGVARWNGTDWEALSSAGFQNVVWALTVFEGELYAGGLFTTAGGAAAKNIAIHTARITAS